MVQTSLIPDFTTDFCVNQTLLFMGDRYLRIVKYKTAYYSFYLPVRIFLQEASDVLS